MDYARWDLMPKELWYLTVENLPVEEILRLCQTSKEFADMCEDNYLWRRLLLRDYGIKWDEGAKKEYIRLATSSMVSCGYYHTGFVTAKGKLYMWGDGGDGRLGNVSGGNRKRPQFIKGLTCIQVSCGKYHTGAVTTEGKLYMWGDNEFGTLGDNTNDKKNKPVFIMENIAQVSCGGHITGAVTEDGKLYMWGNNEVGQIGDGTATDKNKPVLIKIKGNPRFIQVSCGEAFTGAVTAEGNLYMWGENDFGQLGDNSQDDQNKPVLIMKNVTQVSCGYSHTGAITLDKKLYMWGNNEMGQIGDESTFLGFSALSPILIMKNVVQVSCGSGHTGAITGDSQLYMWGDNIHDELGGGLQDRYSYGQQHRIEYSIPTFIMGGVAQVSCGHEFTGVITRDDNLYMWGENNSYQLGNGSKVTMQKISQLKGYDLRI